MEAILKLKYANKKLELQCTSAKEAKKLFGGDMVLTRSLHSRINALASADTIQDIITIPNFRFHKLTNQGGKNLEGYFAIDVKTKREAWRLILQPLNDNELPFDPCNIDIIAKSVRIVGISEVSKHYE